MSELYQSLSHSKWDCKYHVVFVPKRRRKAIFGQARLQLGPIFQALAKQKERQIIEGHLMPDHVHMCICDSTKAPGGVRNRLSEREERHRHRSHVG
jgi:putative transposase